MTREELLPGYYKYKPKWMKHPITIDVCYNSSEKCWQWGHINDCGNPVTDNMLSEIEFERSFKQ